MTFIFIQKKKKNQARGEKKLKYWIQTLIYWTESSLESELGLEAGGFVWVWEASYVYEI